MYFFPVDYPTNSVSSCAPVSGDISRATREAMDDHQAGYNDRMFKIVSVYQRAPQPTNDVIYMGAEIALDDYPIEAFSNVDYFHPSLDAHHFIAVAM